MSKYQIQTISEEIGGQLFDNALDRHFFLPNEFAKPAGKDSYPDIDGQIRLRDGNGYYLNKYFHYQLKSKKELINKKFFCTRKIIDYLIDTNVPTLLFVVDIKNEEVFWYFFDKNTQNRLNIKADKKGRTIDLTGYEVKGNSAMLNHKWQKYAGEDDYEKKKTGLQKVVSSFQDNVKSCVGLLYLLQRIPKKEISKIFNKILKISIDEVDLIIIKLYSEGIINSTVNLYLLDNEQLGVESLFELLNDLDLALLETIFEGIEERKTIRGQLAKIKHPVVSKYFSVIAKDLLDSAKKPTNNDELFLTFELLESCIYRIPEEALKFIYLIINSKNPLKTVMYVQKGFGSFEGKKHDDLIIKCLELLNNIRYFEPKKSFGLLIKLSDDSQKDIKAKATEVLTNYCKYNLHVLNQIGYKPQLFALEQIEKWSTRKQIKHFDSLLEITKELLQLSFEENYMSDYKTLTTSSGVLPINDNLKDIRKRSVKLLKRLYSISEDLARKKRVLDVLQGVSQTPWRGEYGDDMLQMVVDDTNDLINYYIEILPEADFVIIKDIQELAHRFARSFTKGELNNIEQLQSMIASNTEYEMFRIFFGDDIDFFEDLDFEKTEEIRKRKIQEFINSISKENYKEWKKRILSFIHYFTMGLAESYYFSIFIYDLSKQKPDLALRLIKENEKELEPFLAHLVAGIWESNKKNIAKDIIAVWADKGKYLSKCALVFSYTEEIQKALLKTIFKKAQEKKDIQALDNILNTVVRNFAKQKNLKPLFISTIKELNKNKIYNWIDSIWIRWKPISETFSEKDFDVLLRNMIRIPNINYHAERILGPISERYPLKVIHYFEKRVGMQAKKKRDEKYDAIPFQLHLINKPLQENEEIIVPEIIKWFSKKGWSFSREASHFLKGIFPSFGSALEKNIISLIKQGGEKNADIVIDILRAYEGETFLHNVCKEFVKKYPNNNSEMFSVLTRTGFVSGEYGFVEAYKRKKEEIKYWKKDKSKRVQSFAKDYMGCLDKRIAFEQKRADEDIELRKRRFER